MGMRAIQEHDSEASKARWSKEQESLGSTAIGPMGTSLTAPEGIYGGGKPKMLPRCRWATLNSSSRAIAVIYSERPAAFTSLLSDVPTDE